MGILFSSTYTYNIKNKKLNIINIINIIKIKKKKFLNLPFSNVEANQSFTPPLIESNVVCGE